MNKTKPRPLTTENKMVIARREVAGRTSEIEKRDLKILIFANLSLNFLLSLFYYLEH